MLTNLLALKVRREQSIRSLLSRLNQQESALLVEKADLTSEQAHVRQSWQTCCESQGVVDWKELQHLKEELAHYFQRDQLIVERLAVLEGEWSQLQEAQAQQQRLLRKSLLDQEKLQYLLEEMHNNGHAEN